MHARRISIFYGVGLLMLGLNGCAHEAQIPAGAAVVDAGEGRLRYIAVDNGTAYLLDSTTKKPVFSAHLAPADKITIDVDLNLIDVAGKAVEHKPALAPDHVYRLYFDRDS